MLLEDEYSVQLPDGFLTTDKTLGQLFDYVTRSPAGIGLMPAERGAAMNTKQPTQPGPSKPFVLRWLAWGG